MKYLILFLASIATIVSVNGKIPSYIRPCKKNDPDINKCIADRVRDMKDKLVTGMPELNVPPIDPLHLDKLPLNLGPGFKAEGRDLQIRGASNFAIRKIVCDVNKNTYTFVIAIPEATVTGSYLIDAVIAGIHVKGEGPLSLKAKGIEGQGTLHGEFAVRGDKTKLWFSAMDLKMLIDDYTIKLENLSPGDPAIGDAVNKIMNEEKGEIKTRLVPPLEKAMIEKILGAANNITKHFTWDELFPDS